LKNWQTILSGSFEISFLIGFEELIYKGIFYEARPPLVTIFAQIVYY
jgi:hypothetical protein